MEAFQIIYKTSLFHLDDADTLRNFVDRVPEYSLRMIGNLQVRLTVPTWTQNLLTFQLIRSCILNSLPGLLHLNMRVVVAQDSSPLESREICTIEEQLWSSTMLPQLKSVITQVHKSWTYSLQQVLNGRSDESFSKKRFLHDAAPYNWASSVRSSRSTWYDSTRLCMQNYWRTREDQYGRALQRLLMGR